MMTIILSAVGLGLFVRLLVGHLRMWRALEAPPAASRSQQRVYPSVTVIRPIKGMDVGCLENTEALLAQDYPGEVETLFVFDSAADPAYPLVAEIAARSGKNARVVFGGARPARRTGKLNAMIHGMADAHNELIAFCDSDSRPTPALLRELVDELLDRPEAGSTFAPASTLGAPSSFAQVVYGLMINSWYGAAAAELAGEKRELPFIMGQLMLVRREALDAIGGLESAEGQLVDDMFLGAQLSQAGYTNVMVRSPLHLVTGPLSLRELAALLRKWMAFSRSGLPAAFTHHNFLRGADLGLAIVTAVVAALLDDGIALSFSAAALALFTYSQMSLHQRFAAAPVPLRFAWVPLVVPFISGILLATTRISRTVVWRGQSYQLNGAALLAAAPAALSGAVAAVRSSVVPTAPQRNSMIRL
jgi:ceramide glucosyltransferase